jgi:hypothetical protein
VVIAAAWSEFCSANFPTQPHAAAAGRGRGGGGICKDLTRKERPFPLLFLRVPFLLGVDVDSRPLNSTLLKIGIV